jgi:methylenetetrahydrofolate dehydrogenase (NADP+)/methenyltetrahydrofolate cyclohydrolase/formyltetrahydrofolate synthetase
MTAIKIDGTAIAKRIREGLHAKIEERQKANPKYKPSLKIIQGEFAWMMLLPDGDSLY